MYKNMLLMRNGCEGCDMKTCLGVLLAESLAAEVTAVYVTENFTGKEIRDIYTPDELKWPAAGRYGKDAMASAEQRKKVLASEVLDLTEKMCSGRGIRCEKVHLSCKSAWEGILRVADAKHCDVIVASTHPGGAMDMLLDLKRGKATGPSRIPVLFHHAV
jgi:nucleotide-binding universal stress UspA family protein